MLKFFGFIFEIKHNEINNFGFFKKILLIFFMNSLIIYIYNTEIIIYVTENKN